jgi:hypothetical protein
VILTGGETTDNMQPFNERYDAMDYGAVDFYDMFGDMLYYEMLFGFFTIIVYILWKVD